MKTDSAIRDEISREMPYIMSLAAVLQNNLCIVCSDPIRARLNRVLMLSKRIMKGTLNRELDS
jgi:hypothetical protein